MLEVRHEHRGCEAQLCDVQVSESPAPGVVVRHAATVCVTCSRLMDVKEHKGDWEFPAVIVGVVTSAAVGIAYLWGVGL